MEICSRENVSVREMLRGMKMKEGGEEGENEKNILEYRETKKKASSEADVMIISRTRQRRHGGARTGSTSRYGRFVDGKE